MTMSQGSFARASTTDTPGRLRLFAAIVCALLLGAGDARAEDPSAQARHINPQRLQATLEKLSEFGRNPEGGVTRLGFSQTDLDARAYVTSLMQCAGLEVRVDPAGNIYGWCEGPEPLPKLLFGSHIDSVPHGGNFDGPLGSLGDIEVIRALNDGAIPTRNPLEVVIWTNEEGPHFGISALGSGVAAGELGAEILGRRDDDGLTVADWLRRYGQDPARLTDARIAPGALAAILELHIEQGPVLDENKVQIGVVSGIVSLKRWKCLTTGLANHAGTTPMNRRKDALAAAAKHLLALRDVVRAETGTQVGTVGYMKAEPGAPNVIPLPPLEAHNSVYDPDLNLALLENRSLLDMQFEDRGAWRDARIGQMRGVLSITAQPVGYGCPSSS
ncbi:MAG: Zn-dependent hydrolase, partial [Hyphomicrobiaceae bacterium]